MPNNKQGGNRKQSTHATEGKRRDPYYQAQAILSRRDHSEVEVRRKLTQKRFTPAQIEAAIAHLTAKGLLNDAAFAETYIVSTLRFKAVGPRWLRAKLKAKGVADDTITEAVALNLSPEQESALLRQAATEWRRRHALYKDDRERLQRFLLSRGFSIAKISDALADTPSDT